MPVLIVLFAVRGIRPQWLKLACAMKGLENHGALPTG